MHNSKMSKQNSNLFSNLHSRSSICASKLPRDTLLNPICLFTLNFRLMIFHQHLCNDFWVKEWDTHTHTHTRTGKHFPATKTFVALDTNSNSSSFDGIFWRIPRSFEMELNTIAYAICSLHFDLDVRSLFLYLSLHLSSSTD